MLAKTLFSIATLALVAACATPQTKAVSTGNTSASVIPAPKKKPESAELKEKPRLAALTLRGLDHPSPVLPLDPQRLIGMNRAETFAALGTPSQIREMSPATVWRYAMGRCELDLYFFMDLGSNAFRVLTYDVRTEISGSAEQQACLGRLRAASRAQ